MSIDEELGVASHFPVSKLSEIKGKTAHIVQVSQRGQSLVIKGRA